jgi:hypothetical protein
VTVGHQIEQPARGGNDDVRAASNGVDLRSVTHAAEHDRAVDAQVPAVSLKTLGDLLGQLPGGGEHQRPRPPAARGARRPGQAIEDRERERGGLPGSGLGAAEHVAAGEQERDRPRLDRRRGGVAGVGHGPGDRGGQA